MNINEIATPEMEAEKVEAAEAMSFAEMIAALEMESADFYSEI